MNVCCTVNRADIVEEGKEETMTHANISPTFTIKDLAKALGGVRITGGSVRTIACRHVHMGAWSSGMIRASGARGRGFDSRSSPSHTSQCCASSRAVAGRAHPDAGQ